MPINALVVVAHHDDAILWMGGTIKRFPAWNWHVVSMCVPRPERREYLNQTCKALQAKSTPFDFQDYQGGEAFSRNRQENMSARLADSIGNEQFDFVFTHSRRPDGEYGWHANHSEVCAIVNGLVQRGKLASGLDKVAFFSYRPIYGYGGRATVARLDAEFYVQLSYDELLFKCQWIKNAPDADENLTRGLGSPCPNPEAFDGDGLKLPPDFIPK
jgi:LmbE family N-acetylglucosaminyl deacetylase